MRCLIRKGEEEEGDMEDDAWSSAIQRLNDGTSQFEEEPWKRTCFRYGNLGVSKWRCCVDSKGCVSRTHRSGLYETIHTFLGQVV